ncbi:MAG: ribose 1,5-bisphosphate isomerase [Thermofilaceae archaeon]
MEIPSEVLRIAEDIKTMRIRGAGRIARASAYALKLAAQQYKGCKNTKEFIKYMNSVAEILGSTRPTAVSLHNSLRFILSRIEKEESFAQIVEKAISAADEFMDSSINAEQRIGELGSNLLEDGDTVLTHCNSSAALSVIKTAYKKGNKLEVYATETRPKFQGLISYQDLKNAGVPVTLIPDSAVRFFMREVDKVVVGADTVTANGAVVNKVGTSLIALAAHEARVRFYVAAETYKFSPATVLGELVNIEERPPEEILSNESFEYVRARNPAFDITPSEYIDAIITEKGVIPPKAAIMILMEEYGASLKEEIIRITLDMEDSTYPLAQI